MNVRTFCYKKCLLLFLCFLTHDVCAYDSKKILSIVNQDTQKIQENTLNSRGLARVRDQLHRFEMDTQKCIKYETQKINKIQSMLSSIDPTLRGPYVLQQLKYKNQLQDCFRVLVKIDESLNILANPISEKQTEAKDTENLYQSLQKVFQNQYSLEFLPIETYFQFNLLSISQKLNLVIIVVISFLLGVILSLTANSYEKKVKSAHWCFFLYQSKIYILSILPLLTTYLYLSYCLMDYKNSVFDLSFLMFFTVCTLILYALSLYIHFRFTEDKKGRRQQIFQACKWIIILFYFQFLSLVFLKFLVLNPLTNGLKIIYLMVMSIIYAFAFIYLVNVSIDYATIQDPKNNRIKPWRGRLKYIVILFFVIRTIPGLFGHYDIIINITPKVFILVCLYFTFFLFYQLIDKLAEKLCDYFNLKKFHFFKLKSNRIIKPEVYIKCLVFALRFYSAVFLFELIIILIQIPESIRFSFNQILFYGMTLGEFQFVPIHCFHALLCFSMFNLLCMIIIEKFKQKKLLPLSFKDAAVTGFLYIGLFFSSMLSFAIIGFDLISFTVILGGLSFGLGIALQNTMIDFISGIMILIQKPLKMNDLIQIKIDEGKTQGYVKRILLLNTEIVTANHTVIHIPNSNIMNRSLLNYSEYEKLDFTIIPLKLYQFSELDRIQETILSLLKNEPIDCDIHPPYFDLEHSVALDGQLALKMNLCFWIKPTLEKKKIVHQIIENINNAFPEKEIVAT